MNNEDILNESPELTFQFRRDIDLRIDLNQLLKEDVQEEAKEFEYEQPAQIQKKAGVSEIYSEREQEQTVEEMPKLSGQDEWIHVGGVGLRPRLNIYGNDSYNSEIYEMYLRSQEKIRNALNDNGMERTLEKVPMSSNRIGGLEEGESYLDVLGEETEPSFTFAKRHQMSSKKKKHDIFDNATEKQSDKPAEQQEREKEKEKGKETSRAGTDKTVQSKKGAGSKYSAPRKRIEGKGDRSTSIRPQKEENKISANNRGKSTVEVGAEKNIRGIVKNDVRIENTSKIAVGGVAKNTKGRFVTKGDIQKQGEKKYLSNSMSTRRSFSGSAKSKQAAKETWMDPKKKKDTSAPVRTGKKQSVLQNNIYNEGAYIINREQTPAVSPIKGKTPYAIRMDARKMAKITVEKNSRITTRNNEDKLKSKKPTQTFGSNYAAGIVENRINANKARENLVEEKHIRSISDDKDKISTPVYGRVAKTDKINTKNATFSSSNKSKRAAAITKNMKILTQGVSLIAPGAGMASGVAKGAAKGVHAKTGSSQPQEPQNEEPKQKQPKEPEPKHFATKMTAGLMAAIIVASIVLGSGVGNYKKLRHWPSMVNVTYDATNENPDPMTQAGHGIAKSRFEAIKNKVVYGNAYGSAQKNPGPGSSLENLAPWRGKKYNLTQQQIIGLTQMCAAENGNCEEGVVFEIDQVLNLFELFPEKYAHYGNPYEFMYQDAWYGHSGPSRVGVTGYTPKMLENVKAALDGTRYLPLYVNEHDTWNDKEIDFVEINGRGTGSTNVSSITREVMISGKSWINNSHSSEYTFFAFPSNIADPFGYTDEGMQRAINLGFRDGNTAAFGAKGSNTYGGEGGTLDGSSVAYVTAGTSDSDDVITVDKFLDACKKVMDRARTTPAKKGTKKWVDGEGNVGESAYGMTHIPYGGSGTSNPPCQDYISCDRLIARALWDLGFTEKTKPPMTAGGWTLDELVVNLPKIGFIESFNPRDIKPGSVLLVKHNNGNNTWGHAFVVVKFDPITWTTDRYDAGSDIRIGTEQPLVNEQWTYRRDEIAVYNIPPGGIFPNGATNVPYDGSLDLPTIKCKKATFTDENGNKTNLSASKRKEITELGVMNVEFEHEYTGSTYQTVTVVDGVYYGDASDSGNSESGGSIDLTETPADTADSQSEVQKDSDEEKQESGRIDTSNEEEAKKVTEFVKNLIQNDQMEVRFPEGGVPTYGDTSGEITDVKFHTDSINTGQDTRKISMNITRPSLTVKFICKKRDKNGKVEGWTKAKGYLYDKKVHTLGADTEKILDEKTYLQMIMNLATVGSDNIDVKGGKANLPRIIEKGKEATKFVHLSEKDEKKRIKNVRKLWKAERKAEAKRKKEEKAKQKLEEKRNRGKKKKRKNKPVVLRFEKSLDEKMYSVDTLSSYMAKMGYLEYVCDIVDASFETAKQKGFEVDYKVDKRNGVVSWTTDNGENAQSSVEYTVHPSVTLYVNASPDDVVKKLRKISGRKFTKADQLFIYENYREDFQTFADIYQLSPLTLVKKGEFSGSGANFSGSVRAIYDFLHNKGLSDVCIAGILGNLAQETGGGKFENIKTESVSRDGKNSFGIMQWTGDRRRNLEEYAARNNRPPTDLQMQLEFMWNELFSGDLSYWHGVYMNFMTATTPEEAAHWFLVGPEAGGTHDYLTHHNWKEFEVRIPEAVRAYSLMMNGSFASGTDYLEWMIQYAADDRHGYSYGYYDRCNPNGTDTDCSGFVSCALFACGYIPEAYDWTTQGEDMDRILLQHGFVKVDGYNGAGTMNLLQPGDILIKIGHTEVYAGNGQNVGAHSNYDGRQGDSSGKEVSLAPYNGSLNKAYRYSGTTW